MSSVSTVLPAPSDPARALANRALIPVARILVAAGISANAVTALALALSLVSAVMLALGRFDVAGPLIVLASVGDALDGIVARVGATASARGALFDSAADRYQELFILSALAVHLRASVPALALVLAALLASFMVSYGSAKAEAFRVPVPDGSMRRFERALCICAGVLLVPLAARFVHAGALHPWLAEAPILVALAVVAVVGNVSAALRLRVIAASIGPRSASASSESTAPNVVCAP
jgi:CDP-diacylglycerol--glycerol-3-phosphate 3-phosphatidyltransferase